MATYTIELDEAEQKAMEFVAVDVDAWIQNVVHERARVAMDEMVAVEIQQTLSTGGTVSGTKEELVLSSDLPSAAMRQAEIEASLNTRKRKR